MSFDIFQWATLGLLALAVTKNSVHIAQHREQITGLTKDCARMHLRRINKLLNEPVKQLTETDIRRLKEHKAKLLSYLGEESE